MDFYQILIKIEYLDFEIKLDLNRYRVKVDLDRSRYRDNFIDLDIKIDQDKMCTTMASLQNGLVYIAALKKKQYIF